MVARICVVGADRRYRFVNRAFADFHRRPPEEIVGRPPARSSGAAVMRKLEPCAERALAGESVERQGWMRYPNGRRYITWSFSPLRLRRRRRGRLRRPHARLHRAEAARGGAAAAHRAVGSDPRRRRRRHRHHRARRLAAARQPGLPGDLPLPGGARPAGHAARRLRRLAPGARLPLRARDGRHGAGGHGDGAERPAAHRFRTDHRRSPGRGSAPSRCAGSASPTARW